MKIITDLGSLIGNFDSENSIVWDFSNIPATLILLKSIFDKFRGPKTAVLTILDTLNFDFWKNFTLQNVKISQKFKFRAAQMVRMADNWGFKMTNTDFT